MCIPAFMHAQYIFSMPVDLSLLHMKNREEKREEGRLCEKGSVSEAMAGPEKGD